METLNEDGSMKFAPGDALAGMPEEVKNVAIGPLIGVAAIALNMALKYHDTTIVSDGTLYQQYKLEGRNMEPLHLSMVFDTAMQIEEHLLNANRRVARLIARVALAEDNEESAEVETDAGDKGE
jgi:hypothetical protein